MTDTHGENKEVDTSIASRSWQQSVLERIIATLWEYRLELASAFRLFDTDGNGVISKEEFRQGLQALTSMTGGTITDMQADELMMVLDKNGDGSINFEEVSVWESARALACCVRARSP